MFLRGLKAGRLVIVGAVLLLAGCRRGDPAKDLAVSDVEGYWVVDTPSGETQYLAPAVRFNLRNTTEEEQRYIQATAAFRRKGETATWGSDWRRVAPSGRPLQPGQETLVVLKSDARYHSTGAPETMFAHEQFVDASVTVSVKLSGTAWHVVGEFPVERRIGARALQTPAPVR